MSEDGYILAEQNREGVALHSVLTCPYGVLIERACPNLMKSSETEKPAMERGNESKHI